MTDGFGKAAKQPGHHVPGILILNDKLTIGQNINELILIAEASLDGEYQDQIVHLPLTQ